MMITRQRTAAVVFLSFLAAAACASGQTKLTEMVLPANYYYEWIIPAGDPPEFMPINPPRLVITQHALADGTYLCSFGTGSPREIYVIAFRNGKPGEKPDVSRLLAIVRDGNPDPDDPDVPDPDDPPLTGLAKQIYDAATTVGRPADAAKFGQVYRTVASMIAAGGIKNIEDAHREVTKQNMALGRVKKEWKPTFDLVIRALKQYGQTLDGARKTLAIIAQGLERAGQ